LTFLAPAGRRDGCGALQPASDSPRRDILRDRYEDYDRRAGASACQDCPEIEGSLTAIEPRGEHEIPRFSTMALRPPFQQTPSAACRPIRSDRGSAPQACLSIEMPHSLP